LQIIPNILKIMNNLLHFQIIILQLVKLVKINYFSLPLIFLKSNKNHKKNCQQLIKKVV
jgi:hypothetical protein